MVNASDGDGVSLLWNWEKRQNLIAIISTATIHGQSKY